MARYPQGVTSFIPAYQAYQPDFTMMGKMLSIRQNQYDQNWKKLNDVYGSLLYADTTHEQSQEVKDQLKNEIDFNLKRVSGLDLSLEQNVTAAQQVFQPFYENSSLMYDMAATKNVNSAKAKGDSYKNAADPNVSGLYWNEGMDEINYKIQEFKESPYDQIQSSGLAQVQYTPFFNVAKESLALAKDFGDMKFPSSDGKYDYTTTNGKQLERYLQKVLEVNIGQDPRAQARFKTEAYVYRKNYVNSKAGEFGGDKNAAEMNYLEENYNLLAKDAIQRKKVADKNLKGLTGLSEIISNPKSGYIDGQDQTLQKLNQQIEVSKQALNAAIAQQDVATSNKQTTFENIDVLRQKVDFLTANSLMGTKIGEQANVLSYRNYSKTAKLNEEYKMAVQQQNAMNLAFAKEGVSKGTHRLKKDAAGNASVEEIKSANAWQTKVEDDTSGGEVDQSVKFEQEASHEFKQISSYLNQGLGFLEDLDINLIDGAVEDIFQSLSKSSKEKFNSIERLKNATSSYEEFEKSGLKYTDLDNINNAIKDMLFNTAEYSTAIDAKYGEKGPDRDQFNNWQKNSISAHNKIEVGIQRKNWMRKTLLSIKNGSPTDSNLRFLGYAVDSYGNELGESGYRRKVARAQGNKGLEALFADMDMDAATEQRIRDAADKAWDENSGFFNPKIWSQFVAPKLDAFFNTYKLRDGITGNYFNPFDWGKYNLGRYFKQKMSMPDYEDVLESYHNAMKNSDRFAGVNAMPGTRGSGTGSSGMSSYATVVEGASYTKPYQDFYGGAGINVSIADNVQSIMSQGPSGAIYSAFGTTADVTPDDEGKMKDDDINTIEHQDAVKRLWEYAIEETNNEGMGNMRVTVKPGTQFDGNKAGYTLQFDKKFLESFMQKTDADGNVTSIGVGGANVVNDIFKNGATIITDKNNMTSDVWEGGDIDDIANLLTYKYKQNVIENTENPQPASKSYSFGNGYNAVFEKYGSPSSPKFRMKSEYKLFDLNHFVNTLQTKSETSEILNIDPNSLTDNLNMFGYKSVGDLKSYNSEKVYNVSEIIAGLKANKPDITKGEILQVLQKMGYGATR